MTKTQARLFADVIESDYLHKDCKPVSDLLNSDIDIHKVEYQTVGNRTTTYLLIGTSADSAKWFYTQSGVIQQQCEQIRNHLSEGVIRAKLTKTKDYYSLS